MSTDERASLAPYRAYIRRRAELFERHVVGARIERVEVFHYREAADGQAYAGVNLALACADGTRAVLAYTVDAEDGFPEGTLELHDGEGQPITEDMGGVFFVQGATSAESAVRIRHERTVVWLE